MIDARPQAIYLNNCHPELAHWWHPVARSEDLLPRTVTAVQLLGVRYALLRFATGKVAALLDQCPHRRTPLSIGNVVGDTIQCAYHGWQFDVDGRCIAVPALGGLPTRQSVWAKSVKVCEHGGLLWLAPEQPLARPIDFCDADAVAEVRLPAFQARVGAGLMIENFLDVAHFPFIHAATFGGSQLSAQRIGAIADYEINQTSGGLTATWDVECPDHRTGPGGSPCRQRFVYRYQVPFTATVSLEHSMTTARTTSVLAVQPESDATCRIFYHVSLNAAATKDAENVEEIYQFEQQIMAEDLVVQEALWDKRLPLRGGTEKSTVADRLTLAFRATLLRSLSQEEASMWGT